MSPRLYAQIIDGTTRPGLVLVHGPGSRYDATCPDRRFPTMDDLRGGGGRRALPPTLELVRCEPFPVREGSHWPCGLCTTLHPASRSKLAWVRRRGGVPEFSLVLCPNCALDRCGPALVEIIDVTDEAGHP